MSQQRVIYEKLRDGFRRVGISVELVDDILPSHSADESPFIRGSANHHPSALADRLLAQHVLHEIER